MRAPSAYGIHHQQHFIATLIELVNQLIKEYCSVLQFYCELIVAFIFRIKISFIGPQRMQSSSVTIP